MSLTVGITEYLELCEEQLTLGDVIREFRQRMGLTQRELAEMLGCSTPSIWHWEHNWWCPETAWCWRLMGLLEIEEDYFQFLLDNTVFQVPTPRSTTLAVPPYRESYTTTWGSLDRVYDGEYEARTGVGVAWTSLAEPTKVSRPWSGVRSDLRTTLEVWREVLLTRKTELLSDNGLPRSLSVVDKELMMAEPQLPPDPSWASVPPPREPKKAVESTAQKPRRTGRGRTESGILAKDQRRELEATRRVVQTCCQATNCLSTGAARCGKRQAQRPPSMPDLLGMWFCEIHLTQWDVALLTRYGHDLEHYYRLATKGRVG